MVRLAWGAWRLRLAGIRGPVNVQAPVPSKPVPWGEWDPSKTRVGTCTT